MPQERLRLIIATAFALFFVASTAWPAFADEAPPTSKPRLEAALQNTMSLDRPGQEGFATAWDGNKYVQCGRTPDRSLRCEAAGTLMQPSLDYVLTPERVNQLNVLGWRLDPSFGNYVFTFPSNASAGFIADKILQVLATAYDADLPNLEVETTWVPSEACPPRNGPTQNLAGVINNAPSMRATAVHACSYKPKQDLMPAHATESLADLIDLYGGRVTGELARLRVNNHQDHFAIFEAGIGYVQCATDDVRMPSIYCEAQSVESWEALASILTPERIEKLHALGFADPGRRQNYWKYYALDKSDDTTIAHELLTILHDVYGYNGLPALKVETDEPRR